MKGGTCTKKTKMLPEIPEAHSCISYWPQVFTGPPTATKAFGKASNSQKTTAVLTVMRKGRMVIG